MWMVTTLLWLTGYRSAPECTGALTFLEQPTSAQITIRLCMGLIPAIFIAIGLIIMRRWSDKTSDFQAAN